MSKTVSDCRECRHFDDASRTCRISGDEEITGDLLTAPCARWLKRPSADPFARIAQEIGALVSEKQAAYGDSFGKAGQVMRILYGESIPPEKIDDALTVVRVVDKLFRIATRKDAFGESPWRDIVGYGLLAVARDEKTKP